MCSLPYLLLLYYRRLYHRPNNMWAPNLPNLPNLPTHKGSKGYRGYRDL